LSDFPIEQWSERFGVFRNESGDLVPVDDLPLVRVMRGEATDQAQLYVQCPSGKTGRWVTVTGRPLRGPTNRIQGRVVTLVDITAQKQLQWRLDLSRRQLRRVGRLALTAEVAAAASHQLSQPIAAMANYAAAAERLLQTGQLTGEPLRELVEETNRVVGRAAETLDCLRALIRRRKAEPKVVDVNELVWSMLLFFEARLREGGGCAEPGAGRAPSIWRLARARTDVAPAAEQCPRRLAGGAAGAAAAARWH
jgi:signal transduction histidine kinase